MKYPIIIDDPICVNSKGKIKKLKELYKKYINMKIYKGDKDMAELIDNTDIVKGRLIKVKNLKKHHKANSEYISIQVENFDGNNERCLLFTENEIKRAEERAKKNPEDLTEKNWLIDLID